MILNGEGGAGQLQGEAADESSSPLSVRGGLTLVALIAIVVTVALLEAFRGPHGVDQSQGTMTLPPLQYAVYAAAWVDVTGDGRSDYCLTGLDSSTTRAAARCLISDGRAFVDGFVSPVLEVSPEEGIPSWADVDGDGRADLCRLTGLELLSDSTISCTLVTEEGFGPTIRSQVLDWGARVGRSWVDANGDSRADFCRVEYRARNDGAACILSTGTGFSGTMETPVASWDQAEGRAWVDFDGHDDVEYCRVTVSDGAQLREPTAVPPDAVKCSTLRGSFEDWLQRVDLADEGTREWADVNGDGKADFCRLRIDPGVVLCTFAGEAGFGKTVESPSLRVGNADRQTWVDFDGDGAADYCRVSNRELLCTTWNGTSFAPTFSSQPLQTGGPEGWDWADVNGDDRMDYCRILEVDVAPDSTPVCTPSTGAGFGRDVR